MTTASSARGAALLGAGLLCGLTGCSKTVPTTEVSGKILLNGKEPKLTGLQIAFQCSDGSIVSTEVGEDGSYHAVGVVSGEAKVFFTAITEEQAQQAAQLQGK